MFVLIRAAGVKAASAVTAKQGCLVRVVGVVVGRNKTNFAVRSMPVANVGD